MFFAIDLKSFYASVECMERGLDPLTTLLVVADESRTEKTICLAVSPALKSFGIPGRARLFEVVQKVREVNARRRVFAPKSGFTGKSAQLPRLQKDPALELDYVIARPQMARYMEVSAKIYDIYLRYVSPEDIHVYSVDEVFIDAAPYLAHNGLTPRAFCMQLIRAVLQETGITATAGIGTNLYLAKIAMDIEAKHIPADRDGVRIARLDELSYREKLWSHRPLTDFWRVGKGISRKLEEHGMFTMGDVARRSLQNEEQLYRLFGVNAELLIDHAWGWEPCPMAAIHSYVPENRSLSTGQVLKEPYSHEKARLIVREMADRMAMDLLEKRLTADTVTLMICYDTDNMKHPDIMAQYRGEVTADWYGRSAPKKVHGSQRLGQATASARRIVEAMLAIYDRITDPVLLVRRVYVGAEHVLPESQVLKDDGYVQLDLFTDFEAETEKKKAEEAELAREKRQQQAMLAIREKFGRNAILKGTNLEDGATARERNGQVGGHRA